MSKDTNVRAGHVHRRIAPAAGFGLACLAALMLTAGSAAAQEGTPFIKTRIGPPCSDTASGNACSVNFPVVPAGSRRDVTHVACSVTLTNSPDSRLDAELHIVNVNNQEATGTIPLVPINPGGGSSWLVSQTALAPLGPNRRPVITLESFGGDILATTALCTISGQAVPLA